MLWSPWGGGGLVPVVLWAYLLPVVHLPLVLKGNVYGNTYDRTALPEVRTSPLLVEGWSSTVCRSGTFLPARFGPKHDSWCECVGVTVALAPRRFGNASPGADVGGLSGDPCRMTPLRWPGLRWR